MKLYHRNNVFAKQTSVLKIKKAKASQDWVSLLVWLEGDDMWVKEGRVIHWSSWLCPRTTLNRTKALYNTGFGGGGVKETTLVYMDFYSQLI